MNGSNTSTEVPRNNGCQGTNQFYLLLVYFHYCQKKKYVERTNIGRFLLLLGPLERGVTVLPKVKMLMAIFELHTSPGETAGVIPVKLDMAILVG